MTSTGDLIARAASRLVGTPFRLRGRDPHRGLDCVGLVSLCLEAVGEKVDLPDRYELRNVSIDGFVRAAQNANLATISAAFRPGDILVVRPGPAQHHLLVRSEAEGFVHAHAGLGRVVHMPEPSPWKIIGQWRHLGAS